MKNELYENIQKIDTVRAILVGLNTDKSDDEFERSMDELKELTKAIDIEVASVVTQSLNSPDNSTYIGSGKVQEIAAALDILDVSIIIFNDSLSPMQVRNLEKILDTEVIDRTGLILQIFAKRAKQERQGFRLNPLSFSICCRDLSEWARLFQDRAAEAEDFPTRVPVRSSLSLTEDASSIE